MKFAIKAIWQYPPYLRHVATLPWEIKHSNFLQIFSSLKVGRYLRHSVVLLIGLDVYGFVVCRQSSMTWLRLITAHNFSSSRVWAQGNPLVSPYLFTSPPSTLSFSIFYFFPFFTRFIYFLAFPSLPILPEHFHSVSRPDVIVVWSY